MSDELLDGARVGGGECYFRVGSGSALRRERASGTRPLPTNPQSLEMNVVSNPGYEPIARDAGTVRLSLWFMRQFELDYGALKLKRGSLISTNSDVENWQKNLRSLSQEESELVLVNLLSVFESDQNRIRAICSKARGILQTGDLVFAGNAVAIAQNRAASISRTNLIEAAIFVAAARSYCCGGRADNHRCIHLALHG